jgi:hypothetical protein
MAQSAGLKLDAERVQAIRVGLQIEEQANVLRALLEQMRGGGDE